MPESAEVKTFVDALNKEFKGQNIKAINIIGGRFLKEGISNLNSLTFPLTDVEMNCKGKFIYWTFRDDIRGNSSWKDNLFITLGMTGSFGRQEKHSAIEFIFDSQSIFFNDPRHFGTIKVVHGENELNKKLNSLGWDALANPTIPHTLFSLLRKKHNNKIIAEVLLNQKIFACVGNYIRSESLYRAKLHPNRIISSITDLELTDLCNAIINVIDEAYKLGGATIATYKDMYGNVGSFSKDFQVYSKKTDPLGNPVLKLIAKDGRAVHYVKEIQT